MIFNDGDPHVQHLFTCGKVWSPISADASWNRSFQLGPILELSSLYENKIGIFDDHSQSLFPILADRTAILDATQSAQRIAAALTVAGYGVPTALREFRDILTMFSMSLPEAATMSLLTGPRMYYSLLGPFGVVLGAKSRFLRRSIQIGVEIAGIRHPVHLRLRTADVWLCRQILLERQYDSRLLIWPQVIVDAGANIGLASIFYANKYPEAKIIAIEPEPSNYEMLRKNVASYPNVFPIQAALWSKKTKLSGVPFVSRHHMYQVREDLGTDEGCCSGTSGLSLQDLMTEFEIQQIDILKVDIEGSETEVFQGSPTWIQHVGVIAIETHDWMRSGCSEIVCAAATEFELKWQHGETTYFARTGKALGNQTESEPVVPPSDVLGPSATSKYPMKIIQVI